MYTMKFASKKALWNFNITVNLQYKYLVVTKSLWMKWIHIIDNNRYRIYIIATLINHKTSFRVNVKTQSNQTWLKWLLSLQSKKNIHMQYTMVIKEMMI